MSVPTEGTVESRGRFCGPTVQAMTAFWVRQPLRPDGPSQRRGARSNGYGHPIAIARAITDGKSRQRHETLAAGA
jgi:hypothetical protein